MYFSVFLVYFSSINTIHGVFCMILNTLTIIFTAWLQVFRVNSHIRSKKPTRAFKQLSFDFFFEIKIIEISFSTFILLKKQITRPDFLHLNFTHIPFTNYNRWRYVFCLAFAPCSTSLANVTNSALVFCSAFPPIFWFRLLFCFETRTSLFVCWHVSPFNKFSKTLNELVVVLVHLQINSYLASKSGRNQ